LLVIILHQLICVLPLARKTKQAELWFCTLLSLLLVREGELGVSEKNIIHHSLYVMFYL